MTDYRMWLKLNNRARISILTQVGETDGPIVINGIGQTAALASSINIGTAVDDIRKGEVTANIGKMPLNSLIFKDDIAKMKKRKQRLKV